MAKKKNLKVVRPPKPRRKAESFLAPKLVPAPPSSTSLKTLRKELNKVLWSATKGKIYDDSRRDYLERAIAAAESTSSRTRRRGAISTHDLDRALGTAREKDVTASRRALYSVTRSAPTAKVRSVKARPLLSYPKIGRYYYRLSRSGDEVSKKRITKTKAISGRKAAASRGIWLSVAKAKDMTLREVYAWRKREHARVRREYRRASASGKRSRPLRKRFDYVDFLIQRLSGVY